MKYDVAIEENTSSLLYLRCLMMDQTSCFYKITGYCKQDSGNLPLSSLDVVRVEVTSLEVGKPFFGRS